MILSDNISNLDDDKSFQAKKPQTTQLKLQPLYLVCLERWEENSIVQSAVCCLSQIRFSN